MKIRINASLKASPQALIAKGKEMVALLTSATETGTAYSLPMWIALVMATSAILPSVNRGDGVAMNAFETRYLTEDLALTMATLALATHVSKVFAPTRSSHTARHVAITLMSLVLAVVNIHSMQATIHAVTKIPAWAV
jgi:hypothetical protein